jgi:hypothetical protein
MTHGQLVNLRNLCDRHTALVKEMDHLPWDQTLHNDYVRLLIECGDGLIKIAEDARTVNGP